MPSPFYFPLIRLSISTVSPGPSVHFRCSDGQISTDWVSGVGRGGSERRRNRREEWGSERAVSCFPMLWLLTGALFVPYLLRFHICQSNNAGLCAAWVPFCPVVLFLQLIQQVNHNITAVPVFVIPKCQLLASPKTHLAQILCP